MPDVHGLPATSGRFAGTIARDDGQHDPVTDELVALPGGKPVLTDAMSANLGRILGTFLGTNNINRAADEICTLFGFERMP